MAREDAALVRIARDSRRERRRPPPAARRPRGRARSGRAADVVQRLDREASAGITFIFSRAGCDAAVEQCLQPGCG